MSDCEHCGAPAPIPCDDAPEQAHPRPWLNVNGRHIGIPADAVPTHLTPCRKCGRLLPDADPGDVCGACFGSVGPSSQPDENGPSGVAS